MLEVAAEPTRRRLLQLLAPGERTVTQLASQFTVTRSAISQHLGMLAEAGLVTARKQGRERYYRLDERGVLRLRALMESFWSDELDRLVADAAHYPPSQGDCAMPFEKAVVVPLDPTSTFALITQPDRLRRWMAVAARIELRTGGAYRWTVTPGHSAAGTVIDVDRNGITVKDSDGTVRRIESACKVWSAGVSASRLGRDLAEQSRVELDRAGRVQVLPDLSIPGYPNVFVVGDMAAVEGVPGVAQGAIQGAKYVASTIKAELAGANPAEREPFQYFDKGSMATVSRFSAVAKIGPVEFSGFIAWLIWLVLHLAYLIGFKTKITTLLSWTVTFLSTRRGQLTITDQQAFARTRLEQLAELAAEAQGSAASAKVAS